MKNPFSKPSYFKKMTRNERREIFDAYKAEIQNGERPYIARANGMEALNNYKPDYIKIWLFVLSCLAILGSLFVLVGLYIRDLGPLMTVGICATRYAIIPLIILGYIVGLIARKIRLSEYGWHLMLLAVQFVANASAPIIVLYEFAKLGQYF